MENLEDILKSPVPDLIYKYIESKQTDWRRPHLGCSQIGAPCDRAIWYGFRWVAKPNFGGRMLRLFETGQLAEDRLVAELEGIGVKVTDRQKRVHLAPHISGSIDGIGVGFPESKKPHLLEFKTHNAKSWKDVSTKGVQASKPQHYCQMQAYMGALMLERAYYIAVNKDTDELYAERVKFDREAFDKIVERAKAIVSSPLPPKRLSENPSWYECKYCDYYTLCHSQGVPEVNCRTCCHATPDNDGNWTCRTLTGWNGFTLSADAQKCGCFEHLFIPQLLNQEPIDAGKDWIKYEGWTNGANFTRSIDYGK